MVRRALLRAIFLSATGLVLPVSVLQAGTPSRVSHMRLWTDPEHTRIVFDLDKKVRYSLYNDADARQIAIKIKNVQWLVDPSALKIEDAIVAGAALSQGGSG
ncbi:MAG: hypothetical protein HQL80_01880, partial [Magnetococcales bacterium]|nr:hypothetical protein [Magnetococcales bacterium]